MKLIRLRSIANQAVRDSRGHNGKYMIDPFHHHKPTETITIDLLSGKINPDHHDDSVSEYYSGVVKWFHEVLVKEKIPTTVIISALLIISAVQKECIIKTQGKTFKSFDKTKFGKKK